MESYIAKMATVIGIASSSLAGCSGIEKRRTDIGLIEKDSRNPEFSVYTVVGPLANPDHIYSNSNSRLESASHIKILNKEESQPRNIRDFVYEGTEQSLDMKKRCDSIRSAFENAKTEAK